MVLPDNITSFLKRLPLKDMSGESCFVAIVYFLAGGDTAKVIETKNVVRAWSRGLFRKDYNNAFASRAKGKVSPCGKGKINLTLDGIGHVQSLLNIVSSANPGLILFEKGNTHSFDRHLRDLLQKATQRVSIADTFVDGSLFDHLLDEVPVTVPIQFLYGTDVGGFAVRAGRFSKQYAFQMKQSQDFHDRFLIIDDKGYIIGPSLKDAADKKAATMVALSSSDSKKLAHLFSELWK